MYNEIETTRNAHAGVRDGAPRGKRTAVGIQRGLAVSLILAVLGGCATAQVSDVVTANISSARPSEILVDVHAAPMADGAQARAAADVSGELQTALIDKLTKSGITAEPLVLGAAHPGAATLRVTITEADPGNAFERFVIGFGAGRARLQANAELERAEAASPMTAFDTSSNSGHKLGLIVPGGVALATGDAIHLAIGGGIDVATSIRGGMSKPIRGTTSAIVTQLEKYYEQAGWSARTRA